jgi:hypothetical protein
MKRRSRRRASQLVRKRIRRVHRRRFGLGREANEELATSSPHALRLKARRNSGERGGRCPDM